MSINLKIPDVRELKPRITVFGTGGAGGNAVNNMITSGLQGVDFVVANTDAQALTMSKAERIIQMGVAVTEGLGAGSQPEVGRAAAEEAIDEIRDHLQGAHMVFVTAGMGGGTGTGAAPVVARCAKEAGILTVGVVTKPFHFEGVRRMRVAENGIAELHKVVDTLLIIPNQNLFRVANEKTTFADAFSMADQVLYSGVACITDLMVKEGLINLDFADVRAVMREMGKAMMGTGEASGEKRALSAAEAAISNPLIDDASMKGARGLLISITGGKDLTLYEVDEAATRIREEVDQDANIIVGATFDEKSRRHHPRLGGGDRYRPGRPAAGAERTRGPDRGAHPEASRRSAAGRAAATAVRPRAKRAAHAGACAGGIAAAVAAADPGVDRGRCPGRGRGRGAADDGGRDDPADPAETVAVPRADGAAARAAAGAACVHPAGPGACDESAAPHAGHRRTAASGSGRAAGQAGRGRPGSSGKAQGEPAAAARRRRPRPPRRARRSPRKCLPMCGRSVPLRSRARPPDRPSGPWSAHGAADGAVHGTADGPSGAAAAPGDAGTRHASRSRAGVGICQASGSSGSRPARAAGACAQLPRGRPARHPGLPAPAGELTTSPRSRGGSGANRRGRRPMPEHGLLVLA